MYKRNNNGPREEPCGTPQVIFVKSDQQLPIFGIGQLVEG